MSEKSFISPLITRSGDPYYVVPPPRAFVDILRALKLAAMLP